MEKRQNTTQGHIMSHTPLEQGAEVRLTKPVQVGEELLPSDTIVDFDQYCDGGIMAVLPSTGYNFFIPTNSFVPAIACPKTTTLERELAHAA